MAFVAALLMDSVALETSSSIFEAKSVTESVADETVSVAPDTVSETVEVAEEAALEMASVMPPKKQFAPKTRKRRRRTT